MARERTTRGRRMRTPVEKRALALTACALRNFDPNVRVPEGVVCGIFSQEIIEGSEGTIIRQVTEAHVVGAVE